MTAVDEQVWGLPDIQSHNIDVAVIIDVAKRGPSARSQRHLRQSRRHRQVFEHAITKTTEHLHRLTIFHSALDDIHLRINMAICDEEIEPTVIIEIGKACAPLHERITRLTRLGTPAYIRESLPTFPAQIAIEVIRLVREIG